MSISFDSERHADLILALRTATNSITEQLESLESEAERLSGAWSGEARRAYAAAQSRWSASMDSLRSILQAAASSSEQAGSRLAQADRDAGQIWQ